MDDYKLMLNFLNSLNDEKRLLFAEINNQRIKKFEDLLPLNSFFISDFVLDENLLIENKSKEEISEHLDWVKGEIEKIEDWELPNLKKLEETLVKRAGEMNWKVGEVFHPIRVSIVGSTVSPPLFESIYILGKEKTLKFLNL